ncbi:MAG: HEPN domain-containing protein [Candidatus Solibacter usitatus]|nr:HEPN domain-containing protein [Candidatus Solibacter usitatus]
MKNSPADPARQLARKAVNDLAAVRIGLEHITPLETVCIHIRQAVEKPLKAMLTSRRIDYPFTHDFW